MELRAKVQPVGQSGGSGFGKVSALLTIICQYVFGQRLFVIERRESEPVSIKRNNGGPMTDRNDGLYKQACMAGEALFNKGGDAGQVESAKAIHDDRRVGLRLAVEHAPVRRPEADLAQCLADIDNDGERVCQRLSPE